MRDVARDLGHPNINGAYCGYIRQPIYTTKIDDKLYEISGTCVLKGGTCLRFITSEYLPSETCEVYKKKFGGEYND